MQLAHCEQTMQDYFFFCHIHMSSGIKGISVHLILGTYITPDRSSFFVDIHGNKLPCMSM